MKVFGNGKGPYFFSFFKLFKTNFPQFAKKTLNNLKNHWKDFFKYKKQNDLHQFIHQQFTLGQVYVRLCVYLSIMNLAANVLNFTRKLFCMKPRLYETYNCAHKLGRYLSFQFFISKVKQKQKKNFNHSIYPKFQLARNIEVLLF